MLVKDSCLTIFSWPRDLHYLNYFKMKKLILGLSVLAFSFGFLAQSNSIAQGLCEENCNEDPKYYKLAQTGPNTYCCVESTNELDTCSGIPCS